MAAFNLPSGHASGGQAGRPGNDLLFVFAQLDANGNGRRDDEEPVHFHWIDLKDPTRKGRLY